MTRKAFTLIEVLAAISVLAIVLPTVMYGISLAMNLASTSEHRLTATTLAQTKLNELLITTDWQTGALSGDFGADAPGYKWNAVLSDWDDTLVTTIQVLEVHVTWTARNEQHEVVLSTLVNNSASSTGGVGGTALPGGNL